MYLRAQDPQAEDVEVPKLTNEEEYYTFISESNT
jgi:hypothetical protein